jgi:hypothetical protein
VKRLILLLLVAASLAALLLADRTDNTSAPIVALKLVDLDPSRVGRLEIHRPDGSVVLVREGDAWHLSNPVDAAADGDRVNAIVGTLATLVSDGVISRNPGKAKMFAVDSAAGIRVDLYYGTDDQPQATLMVGKLTPGFTHTYVTRLGADHGDEVHRVAGPIRFQLERDASSWRDRRVLNFQPQQITRLSLLRDSGSLDLTWAENGWQTTHLDGTPVPKNVVAHVLTLLSGLYAQSFVDGPSAVGGSPLLTVSLWQEGQDNPIDLVVEAEADGGYQVVADADPQRFIVSSPGLAELVGDFYPVFGLESP